MRDFIVVGAVAVILPFILRAPHIGILAFTWISLMNPHRLTYGFAYGLPYALLLFALTAVVWGLSQERKFPPFVLPTWILLIFAAWLSYTTYHAWIPELAFHKYDRTMKIMAGALLTAILIDRKERVIQLVWIICISLGFYGVKGGLFTILTGGDNRVWGPPDSFMEDNNAMALSLVMVTPLMFFLYQETEKKWAKYGVLGAMILTLVAVVGTYSRGGLLALSGMVGFLWYRTRQKIMTMLAAGLVGLVIIAYIPAAWQERMATIQTFAEDPSVQSRFRSWEFATDIALDSPVVGGGFQVFAINEIIDHGERTYLNAHSIYFEVLAEHGFVGLGLFLSLGIVALLSCTYVMSRARIYPQLEWCGRLALVLQVSMAGYAIGGSFLNMAFFDLYYFLLALVISLTGIVRAHEVAQIGPKRWMVHSAWNSKAPESNARSVVRPTARAG